jgi:hypothetical protein
MVDQRNQGWLSTERVWVMAVQHSSKFVICTIVVRWRKEIRVVTLMMNMSVKSDGEEGQVDESSSQLFRTRQRLRIGG